MDLDLLGINLTGSRLYAHNKPKSVLLALVGFPYRFLVSSVIAAPGVSESIFYYHNDHLGTPQVLTDDQGQIVWKGDYKPFGEADVLLEDVENNFRFPGQYFDQETGLHYNYHRYYSPGIGRYLRSDPSLVYTADANISFLLYQQLQNPQDLNPYVYTKNNAINYMDPAGLYVPPSPTDIYMCILVMENHPELWEPFMDMEPKKDKMAHCALACQVTREYGPWVAHNCALAKEVRDKYDPEGTFDPVDFKASLGGIKVGLDKCKTCIEGCKETGWYW